MIKEIFSEKENDKTKIYIKKESIREGISEDKIKTFFLLIIDLITISSN